MSIDRKEDISAFMDDEQDIESQAAMEAMLKTSPLSEKWRNYHLIRDTLQHQLPDKVDLELSQRINTSIEQEPHILAPVTRTNITYLKPLAGMAIAASVAALAILVIQPQQGSDSAQGGAQLTAFAPVQDNRTTQLSSVAPGDVQVRQVKANARARLNSYLVNYNEYKTNSGFQGMLPHARTVTYENDGQ